MQLDRKLSAEAWKYLLWKNGAASLLVLAVVWGLYVAGLFGMEFQSRYRQVADTLLERKTTTPDSIKLGVAVVFSFLAFVHSTRWINRARILARRGIPVHGTVRRISGVVDFRPLRRVELTYTVEGKAHCLRMTGCRALDRGAVVQLLADPGKPARAMLQEDVLPPGYLTGRNPSG